MEVAIIDYGSGNLRSATKAFERAAAEGGTGATILLTSDPETVANADRIVLPGVGAFAEKCLERSAKALDLDLEESVTLGRILHPSPASPAANRGWAEAATRQLVAQGVWPDAKS